MSSLDSLLAGGVASYKFEQPGNSVTGTVVSVDVRQATEFGTGKPLTWDDGRPQEQIKVVMQTTLRDDADDDGQRAVFIKGWGQQLKAFRAAVAAAGDKPAPGDEFTATFTGYGERPKQGGYPPKAFEYRLVKGAGAVNNLIGAPEPQPTPAAPSAPAAQGQGNPAEQAKQLIALNLTDEQIHSATGLDMTVIAALRAA